MEENPAHECKNCSTEIEGQFCHFCGQRYHDHKESFGELGYEFFSDFLHFDSRFFKTILPLIFQPGKLTKSYNEGKQRSQFHPIRLYLFSSFVYFFLFFYFNNVDKVFESNESNRNSAAFIVDSVSQAMQKDSLEQAVLNISDSISKLQNVSSPPKTNSLADKKAFVVLNDSNTNYSITVTSGIDSLLKNKVTPQEYIKWQKSHDNKKKAGYFERIITARLLEINLKGDAGKKEFLKKVFATFLHNIPKMLFFLLPVFALLLKFLYIRRKQFYFVDHAVLSLHYFSLVFLLLILCKYILDRIFNTDIFTIIAVIWTMIYLLIAMKRLYGQKWGKTIFKYLALGFLFSIAVLITLLANMALSALIL